GAGRARGVCWDVIRAPLCAHHSGPRLESFVPPRPAGARPPAVTASYATRRGAADSASATPGVEGLWEPIALEDSSPVTPPRQTRSWKCCGLITMVLLCSAIGGRSRASPTAGADSGSLPPPSPRITTAIFY